MKTLTTAMRNHLRGDAQTTALCWRIVKRDNTLVLGTEHDQDITIPSGPLAGTYLAGSNITPSNVKSSGDLSVDNLDVSGALAEDGSITIDITVADIEAGNFNFAVIKSFFVNWADLTMGIVPVRSGVMGQVTYDSNGSYKTEVRGLSQLLQQNIIRTYSDKCNVIRFGDSRCNFNVASLTILATVSAVVSRKQFTLGASGAAGTGQWFNGNVVGVAGSNGGFLRQVKSLASFTQSAPASWEVVLDQPMPKDVMVGDTFNISPGCDRLWTTCLNDYNNIQNNRAYGKLIPGIDALLAGPAGQMNGGQ